MVDWQKYKNRLKDEPLTEEQEAAFATAARITKPEKPIVKRKNKAGDKRRARHNSLSRNPFQGCTESRSNMLRDVVALHLGSSTLREAFTKASKIYDVIPNTVEKYYYKHKEAVLLAEEEHMAAANREYHQNLVELNAAVSEHGSGAIKTIAEVMYNSKNDNSKLRAAEDILKLGGLSDAAKPGEKQATKNEALEGVKEAMKQEGEQESHVKEAEDVGVLEGENASEARVDRCM